MCTTHGMTPKENTDARSAAYVGSDLVASIHKQMRVLKHQPDLEEAKTTAAWTRLQDLQQLFAFSSPQLFTEMGKFQATEAIWKEGYKILLKWIQADVGSFDIEIERRVKAKRAKLESKQESKKEEEKITSCWICHTNPATLLYQTCGHYGVCPTCSEQAAVDDGPIDEFSDDDDQGCMLRYRCGICRKFSRKLIELKIASNTIRDSGESCK